MTRVRLSLPRVRAPHFRAELTRIKLGPPAADTHIRSLKCAPGLRLGCLNEAAERPNEVHFFQGDRLSLTDFVPKNFILQRRLTDTIVAAVAIVAVAVGVAVGDSLSQPHSRRAPASRRK